MSDYPSWSDERDSYADANWSSAPAPPPAAPYYHGGSSGYPGADQYSDSSYANDSSYTNRGAAGYAGYENRGSAGYGAAGGGGYGGGAGGYSSTSSYVPKPAGAAKASEVSYDTSSRDPAHLRARVFIGCLGKGPVVREDIIELCRPFGPLMAVTLFKGYAFVQFEQAEDADNACEVLNGKRWKSVNIDVHLAMEGLVRKTLPPKRPAESSGKGGGRGGGSGGSGRGSGAGAGGDSNVNDWPGAAGGSAKRSRPSSNVGMGSAMGGEEALLDVNEQNKKSAMADSTAPEMIGTEMADTLICGTCRYVTSDFIAFREHRKKPCVKPKESVEPTVLRCASCGLRFLTAWKMLFHLTDFHRMQLFKPDYSEEALERAKTEDERYKQVSATRMEAWRQEQENDKANAFVAESTAAAVPSSDGQQQRNGSGTPQAPKILSKETVGSFANDEDINTFGGGGSSNGNGSSKMERVTTGADYDEDEEDEDEGAPSTIPTLG